MVGIIGNQNLNYFQKSCIFNKTFITIDKKIGFFSIGISPKNRLLAITEEILVTDNRLRKKLVENR